MIRLVGKNETPAEALVRMDAQLGIFAERFRAELHAFAGGKASPYVDALARAAMHAAAGTLALVAVPNGEPTAEANRLASAASDLLDRARAAAGWERVVRRQRAREKNTAELPTQSPVDPPGTLAQGAHRPKFPTLSELISFVVKHNQAPEFLRLLDSVEADELAKAKPSNALLRRVETARRKVQNQLSARARHSLGLMWCRP